MKRLLNFAASLSACALLSVRAATPVAEWTDFHNTASGGYTLNIDSSCAVNDDGSVTIGEDGGLTLALPAGDAIRTGKKVTVVADLENVADTTDKRTIFALDVSGNNVNLTKGAELNGAIFQMWNDSTGHGNIGRVDTIGRAQLALAYASDSGTDSWIEGNKKASSGNLKSGSGEIANIFIGSKNGTAQVMKGLRIYKLTIYAGKLTTAADICGTNHPNQWLKFNGNFDNMGLVNFGALGEAAENWARGVDGQAMKVVDGATHPFGSGWDYGSGAWTVTVASKPIANASSKVVFWATGVKAGWFGLLADSANHKVLLAYGDASGANEICSVSVPDASETFHLYTVRNDGANNYELIVDSDIAGKGTAVYAGTVPSGAFQIGAVNQGLPTGLARTTGTLIDDLRVYKRAISDDEIGALTERYTPKTYCAQVDADTPFSAINWTPSKPAITGFEKSSLLVITNTAAATITFDEAFSVYSLKFVNGASKALTAVVGNVGWAVEELDCAEAVGGVAIDASGLNGMEIARNSVSGVPYSRWISRNVVKGTPSVICPTAPSGYSINSEVLPKYGVRLVATAPATAKFGAVNMNLYRDDNQRLSGTGDHGLYPADLSKWGNLKVVNSGSVTNNGVTFTLSSSVSGYSLNNTPPDMLQKQYMDDNNDGVTRTITVSGMAGQGFREYRVIVYFSTDSADTSFAPMGITVAGLTTYYAGPTELDTNGGYTVRDSQVTWGHTGPNHNANALGEGVNALMSDVMTADSFVLSFLKQNGKRATPAAIQIVKAGAMDYYATMSGSGKLSALAWAPTKTAPFIAGDTFTITNVASAATLTFDEDVAARKMTLVSADGKNATFRKSAETFDVGSFDFSVANGMATFGFDPGALITAPHIRYDFDVGTKVANKVIGASGIYEFKTATIDGFVKNVPTLKLVDDDEVTLKNGATATVNTSQKFDVVGGTLYIGAAANGSIWYGDGTESSVSGGKVVVRANGQGQNGSGNGFLIGFSGGCTLNISGGELNVENSSINFWSKSTINMTGGKVKAKGVFKGSVAGTVNIGSDATFELGSLGWKADSCDLNLAGTLRAFETAQVNNAIAYTDGATLAADPGKMLVIRSSVTGEGTIACEGEVVFLGVNPPAGITGTYYYGYILDVNDLGKFKIPEGKTAEQIRLFDTAVNPLTVTKVEDGYIYTNWKITGDSCWWDYEFNGNLNNIGTEGTALTWDGGSAFPAAQAYLTNVVQRGDVAITNVGIRVPCRPYRDVSSWPGATTFVMYGKVPSEDNTVVIGFGSQTHPKGNDQVNAPKRNTIFLAVGDASEGEVKLCKVNSFSASTVLCTMKVPNATATDHLYAFVLKAEGGKTVVNTYLDGKLLQPYTFDGEITLGNGFQLGSIHGGTGGSGYTAPTKASDRSMMDFLRVYNEVLTDEALAKYAEEYPYVSGSDRAERSFVGEATWTAENTWTLTPFGGVPYQTSRPSANAMVTISASAASTIAFDLDEPATYETFDISAGSSITLRKGGSQKPSVSGLTKVGAGLTVDYDAIAFNGPITVQSGNTLTFDFRSLDATNQLTSVTNVLTGMVTLESGAQVVAINLAQPIGRVVEFVQNGATKQYELRITVLPFVYTINGSGPGVWTWGGTGVSEDYVDDRPPVPICKEGSGTLEKALADNRAYVINGGTFKAVDANGKTVSVTINKNATFDINGSYDGYVSISLKGGSLVNNGTLLGTGSRQLNGITLTADSTVGGQSDFGLISDQWGANTLALGGRALTKVGTNTFFLCSTTITGAGSIDVQAGAIEVFKTSSFAGGTVKNAGAIKIDVGQSLTVGKIAGGVIDNSGTLSAFSLGGEVALVGDGNYGIMTLVDSATVDILTRRGLQLGGTGNVSAVLTEMEVAGTSPIVLFDPVAGANISLGKVRDSAGNDITSQCRLEGGTLTICQAKIGSVMYKTLALAVAAVRDGQVIELLSAAEFSGTVTNAFSIDVCGNDLDFGPVDIKGSLAIGNSVVGGGLVSVVGIVSVSGGAASKLVLNVPVSAGGGHVSILSGSLENTDTTVLDGVDLLVGANGWIDLSSGTSVRCRNFTSLGAVVGTNATLVVDGVLDASYPIRLVNLGLASTATIKGTELDVTRQLSCGDMLRFVYSPIEEGMKVATVPVGTDVGGTALIVNGESGKYELYLNPGDTALRIKKSEGVVADVRLSVDPDTNKVNRVNFESAVISGEINVHGIGGEAGSDAINAYLVARAGDGTVVTQKIDRISDDGGFTQEFGGLDAGKAYEFSAQVDVVVGGQTKPVKTIGNAVDFVSARSIERTPDGSGGWIYEDAETFAGVKEGTGIWYGTNDLACVDNKVISLFAEDWTRTAEFQPTNMNLDLEYSYVKDLHFHVSFDCPGFYSYESYPVVQNGVSAAFTLVADDEDNCSFAVVSGGGWKIVPRDVFPPALGVEYDVLVRLDGVASNIQYSVISGGNVTRLATCPVVETKDISLDLTGSGDVALIEGVGQNAHLAQVGDEQYWKIGDAIGAAGGTNNVIPLWWSSYAITDDGGAFLLRDPHGYLKLIWKKWHHWSFEDGVCRWISGNNWIEYADEAGVVKNANGTLLVTNEFGLAWIAEQATNRWFCGDVSVSTNLDLSSKNWTPIAQFMGAFDGRGYTIKGLNNSHVIYTNLLGSAGYYFGGPSNDWSYTAYGLFGSATNAAFANVTFEDAAISNVADSAAVLLGVHAGGTLAISNVTVASGRVQGEGRAVAGVLTVGGNGESVGDIVMVGTTNRATIAGTIANDADGGNVAQILAGTTWGTVFEGDVVVTNVAAEGVFDVSVTDGMATKNWYDSYFSWFDLPVCNFAAAVMRFTEQDGFRRFVEANEPESVPIDPVHRTARMLAGNFANGADNVAGWWMDTITATPEDGHVDIEGEGNIIDMWESVLIDRNLSLNLNSNFVYTVYDNDTFTIAEGVSAMVSNGVIYVGEGYEAFGGDTGALKTNNVTVVTLDENFYERTVLLVDGDFLSVSEALDYIHAGSCIELFDDTGLTIDAGSNAVLLDGRKIADLPAYQSLVDAGDGGTVAYMVRLNEKAVPDYDFELMGAEAGHDTVKVNIMGARAGLYYAVQHKASLVENWSEPVKDDWVHVKSDGSVIQFTLPASESSGFYRVKVTDYLPEAD